MWAEAAALTGHPDAEARFERARLATGGNPIATALVKRAAALADDARPENTLSAVTDELRAAGCRYQWARTLVIRGGADRKRGEAELTAMGATPMVWSP
jgi:hypothetical protein